MPMDTTIKKRFVISPTTAMEYDGDKEGFDNYLSDTEKKAVDDYVERAEKDAVNGSESLHIKLYKSLGITPSLNSLTGNEGFMDTIKNGIRNLIKRIVSFFAWIRDAIFGRKKTMEQRISESAKKFEDMFAEEMDKEHEYTYHSSIRHIKGPGKIPNNLKWVDGVFPHLAKHFKQTDEYIKKLTSEIKSINDVKDSPEELSKKYSKMAASCFGASSSGDSASVKLMNGAYLAKFDLTGKGPVLSLTVTSKDTDNGKYMASASVKMDLCFDLMDKRFSMDPMEANYKQLSDKLTQELEEMLSKSENPGVKDGHYRAVKKAIDDVIGISREMCEMLNAAYGAIGRLTQ